MFRCAAQPGADDLGGYPGGLNVSEVAESQVAGGTLDNPQHPRAAGGKPAMAIVVVIAVTTALALALRVYYQSTLSGFLLGAR